MTQIKCPRHKIIRAFLFNAGGEGGPQISGERVGREMRKRAGIRDEGRQAPGLDAEPEWPE